MCPRNRDLAPMIRKMGVRRTRSMAVATAYSWTSDLTLERVDGEASILLWMISPTRSLRLYPPLGPTNQPLIHSQTKEIIMSPHNDPKTL